MTRHRRRYYRSSRPCQDCGATHKPVTLIRFWATGMRYIVCAECIRPYRKIIVGYVPGDRP